MGITLAYAAVAPATTLYRVDTGVVFCRRDDFGAHKIDFHQTALGQNDAFSRRASAAKPLCGDFCFVWEGSANALIAPLDQTDANVIEGPVQRQRGGGGGTATGSSWYARDSDGNPLEFTFVAEWVGHAD